MGNKKAERRTQMKKTPMGKKTQKKKFREMPSGVYGKSQPGLTTAVFALLT